MSILYMMIGPPGSGKSYKAQHIAARLNANIISRDEIRFTLLRPGDEYFSKEKKVYSTFVFKIREALNTGMNVIVDATNLNKVSRDKLLKKVTNYDRLVGIVMNTSLETCLERNAKRQGIKRVPEKVVIDMYQRMTFPLGDENFDAVVEVDGE